MKQKTMKEGVIYVFNLLGHPGYVQASGKISKVVYATLDKDEVRVIAAVYRAMLLHKMYGEDKVELATKGQYHPPDSFFKIKNPFKVVYT